MAASQYRHQVTGDCEELLGRFQSTDSVRFETFARIWRDMAFSHIYHGTTDGLEGKVFSRQILAVACRYFLPPYTFQIRVGALYLLYGLYHQQVAVPRVQIQVALKDWEEVSKFQKDAVEAQHLDAVYILRKLFSQKAFCFAAMPRHLSYSQKRIAEKQSVCEEFIEPLSRPQELVSSDFLEELSNVHEHYQCLQFSQHMAHRDLVHPFMVKPDLVPQLHQIVVDFNSSLRKGKTTVQAEEDSGEGLAQKESALRAKRLADLKSKSFGQAVEASKSRRHRQVELGSHVTPGTSRPRRASLKTRVDRRHSTGAVKMEASRSTKVWKLTAPLAATDDVPRKHRGFKW